MKLRKRNRRDRRNRQDRKNRKDRRNNRDRRFPQDKIKCWVNICRLQHIPSTVKTNMSVTTYTSHCNNKYLIVTLLQTVHIVTTFICCNNIVTTNKHGNNIVTSNSL